MQRSVDYFFHVLLKRPQYIFFLFFVRVTFLLALMCYFLLCFFFGMSVSFIGLVWGSSKKAYLFRLDSFGLGWNIWFLLLGVVKTDACQEKVVEMCVMC